MADVNIGSAVQRRFSETVSGRGPLAPLTKPVGKNVLTFPGSLNDTDHWVCFRAAKYSKLQKKSITQQENIASIYLPVPQDLKTGYKAGYNNESLGIGGALALQVAQGEKIDKGDVAMALGTDLISNPTVTGLLGAGAANALGGSGAAQIVGGAVGVGAGQAVKATLANKGIARNPHQAVLFQGVDFRNHSFNYTFTPRNENESEILQGIIYAFKFFMAPRLKRSNHFFDYPEQFDIDFKDEKNLFDIGTSVLTSFDVNYHAAGQSAYYVNNHPVSINLSMNFQEVTITTKDEIEKLGR